MDTLEDLLVEEGFKAGRMKSSSRASFKADAEAMQHHQHSRFYQESPLVYLTCDSRTKRSKSDVAKRTTVGTGTEENERPRRSKKNISASGELYQERRKKVQEVEICEERDFGYMHEEHAIHGETLENEEITMWNHNDQGGTDFNEEAVQGNLFKNDVRATSRKKQVDGLKLKSKTAENLPEFEQEFGKHQNKTTENGKNIEDDLQGTVSHQPAASSRKSNKSSQQLKVANNQRQGKNHFESAPTELALNEVAIQATVSILSGYIRRCIKDENFREMLHNNCLSCLGLNSWKDRDVIENGVLSNLKQAIETIEVVVTEEGGNSMKLKKASLQLSVIAGLNTKDFKDGLTSRVPNSHLGACAHIYLSIISKLQKKDTVCSKHLLQVFCESPYQARSRLLCDLWEHLFLPHLSHLRVWYDQETKAVTDASKGLRKMKTLEKLYNKAVDSSTYQFAQYYKEWLTDGVEAPAVPSIIIPTISVNGFPPSESCELSPRINQITSAIQMPSMSKELFQPVDIQPGKRDEFNEQNIEESGNALIYASSASSLVNMSQKNEHINNNHRNKEQVMHEDSHRKIKNCDSNHKLAVDTSLTPIKEAGSSVPCQMSHVKANELILKKLAKAVFQLQLHEEPSDSISANASNPNLQSNVQPSPINDLEKVALPSSITSNENHTIWTSGEPCGYNKYYEHTTFFSSIPKDFICPLSSQPFEDPVTLETGYTFEREAIASWFSQGNKTCPLTGVILYNTEVPVTNLVLKHVIDGWKSEYCKSLLIIANQLGDSSLDHKIKSKEDSAVMILEMLLKGFNTEEKQENVKLLISLGGLKFLTQRFEQGQIHEKARIAALLTCCIKTNGNCRNYIATRIIKPNIIEILHSNEARFRINAVQLLIELICLHRKTSVTSFSSNLNKEEMVQTLQVLLTCLQEFQPEQKVLVAVLLLNFTNLEKTEKFSRYKEEAVEAITVALKSSSADEKIRKQTCRALLLLGGQFSTAGEPLIEVWVLKRAGYYDSPDTNTDKNDEKIIEIDQLSSEEQEQEAREEWLNNLSLTLLSHGRRPFLKAISKCLSSKSIDLKQTCLTTVAWLSHSICSTSATEFQLKAFSFILPKLKACLESEHDKNKVLACMTLLNFTKISECRALLCSFSEQIIIPIRKLKDTTRMAKQLLIVISKDGSY